MNFSKQSDAVIWNKITNGSNLAFEYVYGKYSDELFRYGQKLTKDRDLVEDAIHDVFLKLWAGRTSLQIKSSFRYYLLRSFRRIIIKKINANRKIQFSEELESSLLWESSIQELLLENQIMLESNRNVRNAINNLSDRQREAIFLKYMEGLSYEEISRLMNMQVPSLYNLITRALKNLSEFLSLKQTYIKSLLYLLLFIR